MKKILLRFLAIVLFASCTKEEIIDPIGPVRPTGETKELVISFATNTAAAATTKATGATLGDDILLGEYYIHELHVVCVDKDKKIVDMKHIEKGAIIQTDPTNTPAIGIQNKINVNANTVEILLVANASAESTINDALKALTGNMLTNSTNISTIMNKEITLTNTSKHDYKIPVINNFNEATSAGCLMINSGEQGLVTIAAVAGSSTFTANVNLERILSKARVGTKTIPTAGIEYNTTAWIRTIGFLASTTNKKYTPLAKLATYNTTNHNYREDLNYTEVTGATDLAKNFSVLDAVGDPHTTDWKNFNSSGATYNTVGSVYFYENTMDATAQKMDQSTKLIFKMIYTPKALYTTTPTSGSELDWFTYNHKQYTFTTLLALYDAGNTLANPTVVEDLNAFAKHMSTSGKNTFVSALEAELSARENGGYIARTIVGDGNTPELLAKYKVEYYQKSVCYYRYTIKHDSSIGAMKLGRWGTVRNNCYDITITGLKAAGIPYIPVDDNRDNDIVGTNLELTITVLPWTYSSEEVELG